jgi:hypothetical protein
MKTATRFFLYSAMASFACLLAGILLGSLDQHFPSTNGRISLPNNIEAFVGSTEGLTLSKIGAIGFLLSAISALALTIIQKVRNNRSSA